MNKIYSNLLLFTLILISSALLAQPIPQKIPFQGVLYEAGEPVTATKQMIFSIAAVSWTETHSVSVVNGLYSVVLGEITPFPENLFETSNTASLGIIVAGSALPPVEIHAPFLNEAIVARNMPKTVKSENVEVRNDNGDLRAEMTYDVDNDKGRVVLYNEGNSPTTTLNTNSLSFSDSEGNLRSSLNTDRLAIYDSENNPGVEVRVYDTGEGNLFTYNEQHKRSGWFGNIENNGFIQLVDYNEDGSDSDGAILAGFWAGKPELYLELGNGQHKVDLSIENNAGKFWLAGENSQNIYMETKHWEENGTDLPYMKMVGTSDDMIWMDVSQDTNTSREWGNINFSSTDGANTNINADGIDLNGPNGENFRIDYNGFSGDIQASRLGGEGVAAGEKDWEPGIQGFVHLYGETPTNKDNIRAILEVNGETENNSRGVLALYGPVFNDSGCPNCPRTFVDASVNISDENGGDPNKWFGQLNLQGHNSQNIELGAKQWEENGTDLPYMKMVGTSSDMIWMDVSQDTNTSREWGNINFSSSDGASTNVNADGIDFHGPNGEHFNLGYNGLSNNTRFSGLQIQNGNDDGEVIDIGHHGPDGNHGYINIRGNDKELASLTADSDGDKGTEWGSINIQGHSSPNFRVGAKSWEDNNNGADLPYMALNGFYTRNDGDGDYQPDMIWMDVTQDTNTNTEFGSINLHDNHGAHFGIDAYGFTGGTSGLNVVNPARDADVVGIGRHGTNDDLGFVNVNGSNNQLKISINVNADGPAEEWGEIAIQGVNGPNTHFGAKNWEENGGNLPFLNMVGTGGNMLWMDVSQDTNTGSEWGAINLHDTDGNNAGIDGTGSVFASQNLAIGYHEDSGVRLDRDGSIEFKGPNDEHFRIDYNGFHGEIENFNANYIDAGNQITLKQQSNPANNSFEVYNNGDASYMNLNNSNNGNSISLDGDAGSIDAGSINLKESLNVGGNSYDGELNVSAMTGTSGLRMYGDFNSIDGQGARGHIAIDGSNDNHVWMWGDGAIDATGDITATGDIRAGGGAITLNSNGHISASTIDASNTSDKRFKKNIKPLENALSKTTQLNGKSYQWNELAEKEKSLTQGQKKIGVIAQEVEKQFPALVETDAKGYKSVDYAGLTAVLLEAIKELSAKVTTLESENSELKASLHKVSELESKIKLIEKLLTIKPAEADKSVASK